MGTMGTAVKTEFWRLFATAVTRQTEKDRNRTGSDKMSISSIIRNQGNDFFRQACSGKISDLQKSRELFDQALSRYYKAKEKAEDSDDECSAAKNIGKAAWRIAGVLTQKLESFQTILHYQREAIKGLCEAFNKSEDCKPEQWRNEVLGTLTLCLQEVIDWCDTFHPDSNPVSPEPPGPRAQAPRRPWGRECDTVVCAGSSPIVHNPLVFFVQKLTE